MMANATCEAGAVTGLNHVNIRTTDLAATADFYRDVLGLTAHDPVTTVVTQSKWLRDRSGNAIIHLRPIGQDISPGGAIDHVAINCSGKDAMLARLTRLGIGFAANDGLMPGMMQVILAAPDGVKLELVFMDE